MTDTLSDIPGYGEWTEIRPVTAGWSPDSKFRITDREGRDRLLRVSDGSLYGAKRKEFSIIGKFNALDIPISQAVSFGRCNAGKSVYMLLSWIDGCPLQEALPLMSQRQQYATGLRAGAILKMLHGIAVDPADYPKENRKIYKLKKLAEYANGPVRVENDDSAMRHVRENIEKINPLPPVYRHGDFHAGNLLLTADDRIGVIDFNRWSCGDRYEDFYKIQCFDVETSIPFSIGRIDGYFEGNPPQQFWDVLAVYVAHASLCMINWAERFGEEEIRKMVRRCRQALADYDGFGTVVPRWYTENYLNFRSTTTGL